MTPRNKQGAGENIRHPFTKSGNLVHRRKNGFTYIELIVVIIILGILIGLSIPQLKKSYEYFQLDDFAKNIYLLCGYLQSASISEAKIHCLNFSRETRGFKSYSLTEDGQWQILRGRFSRFYKVPEKVTLEIIPADKQRILFYPDGSIDNLEILFKNEFGPQRTLMIKGVSGEIKIQ